MATQQKLWGEGDDAWRYIVPHSTVQYSTLETRPIYLGMDSGGGLKIIQGFMGVYCTCKCDIKFDDDLRDVCVYEKIGE